MDEHYGVEVFVRDVPEHPNYIHGLRGLKRMGALCTKY